MCMCLAFTGIHAKNRYALKNSLGQQCYFAHEGRKNLVARVKSGFDGLMRKCNFSLLEMSGTRKDTNFIYSLSAHNTFWFKLLDCGRVAETYWA